LITCSQGLLNYLAFLFMSFSSLFNKSFQWWNTDYCAGDIIG
jgi:thiamine transporter ThiT